MATRDLGGKIALVTGAASGIGRATALALARAGADLWLCDIDEPRLGDVAGEARALGRRVGTRRVDVARRDEMRAFADEVHAADRAVDVLVNNAGVGLSGTFLDTSLEDWEWVLSINLWGVIHGCHYFVPKMVERGGGGYVVNVSSMAGVAATDVLSAYSTSKFGVFGLSEALRDELRPHGIGVATICPGVIDTPIVDASRALGQSAIPEVRARVTAEFRKRSYGPERVADAIVDAVTGGGDVVPVTPEAWALYFLKRIAPGAAARVLRRATAVLRPGGGP